MQLLFRKTKALIYAIFISEKYSIKLCYCCIEISSLQISKEIILWTSLKILEKLVQILMLAPYIPSTDFGLYMTQSSWNSGQNIFFTL